MNSLRRYFTDLTNFHPNARRFMLFTIIATFTQSIYGLVFNLFILELGYTREFIGTLESLPAFVIAALAVPLALLCSNISLKKTLVFSTALGFAAATGAVLFPARIPLMACRFFSGVAGSLSSIAVLPFLARHSTESERNRLFSAQFSFSMVSSFAGSLLGGQITRLAVKYLAGGVESAAAYRVTLLASVALMALMFIPLVRIKDEPAAGRAEAKADLSKIDFNKLMWVLAPQVIIGLGAGMVIPYLNLFFKTSFPMSIGNLGAVMALMPLSMAVGGFLGPYFVKKMGHIQAMILFQALSIPFLATVGFSGVLWATVLAAFLRTMLMNASWPLYSVFMLGRFDKKDHAMVSAIYAMAWNLLWSLGARMSGTMQMEFGWTVPFLGTIICYATATLILSRKFLREEVKKTAAAVPAPINKAME